MSEDRQRPLVRNTPQFRGNDQERFVLGRDGRDERSEKFWRQAALYSFPYHWLPTDQENRWQVGRHIAYGIEYLAVLEVVRHLVRNAAPTRVLDFGCGDGRLSFELLSAGVPRVLGLDLVEEAVGFARSFCASFGARCDFSSTPIAQLRSGPFDVVVAMEVLEHIPSTELSQILPEISRRLTTEGRFIVSVPTENLPLNPKHERHYSLMSLTRQLAPHFTVDEVRFVHRLGREARYLRSMFVNRYFMLTNVRFLRLLTRWYRSRLLTADAASGAHLVVSCVKS